jgi:hypothetical protein
VSQKASSSNEEILLTFMSRIRAFQNYVKEWEQAEPSAALSSNFCEEAGTHGSQGVGRSAISE